MTCHSSLHAVALKCCRALCYIKMHTCCNTSTQHSGVNRAQQILITKMNTFLSIRIAAIHSYWSHVAKDRLLAHMKKILSDTALMYHKSLTDCSIIRKDCVRGAED